MIDESDSVYRENMDLATEELCMALMSSGITVPDNTSDMVIVEIAAAKLRFMFEVLMELCATNPQSKAIIKAALKH